MMNDIRPSMRPQPAERPPESLPPVVVSPAPAEMPAPVVPQPPAAPTSDLPAPVEAPLPPEEKPARVSRRKLWLFISIGGVLVLLIAALAAAWLWYNHELSPARSTALSTTRVTIDQNASPSSIAELLYKDGLIRNSFAFTLYARLSGTGSKLQAGTYNLSPTSSTPDIINHLVAGKTDIMRITFLPGATLWPNPQTPEDQRTDVESVLLRAGYKKADIEAAFMKQYDHPLMAGRPAGADIEGYVYGETYDFNSDATLDDVFTKVFDAYYAALQQKNVVPALQQQGLSLYQGITLASIVQREVSSTDPRTPSHDQEQVAQIFLLRLAKGMPLGSDVTAYYGAIKAGQSPSVSVDTPYNTRIHAGLPPGPIATPSIGALESVAHPAPGDYLFFLSGDDDVMYYAHTDAEHQANIKAHCQVKCAVS